MDRNDWPKIWEEHVRNDMRSPEGDWTSLPATPDLRLNNANSDAPFTDEPTHFAKYKRSLAKARSIGLIVGLLLWIVMPLFPKNEYYRVSVSVFLLGLSLTMFVSSWETLMKKIDTLIRLVSALTLNAGKRALRLADFAACQPLIKAECRRILSSGQDLELALRVVAAHYSWAFFRELLADWSREFPDRTITFVIQLVRPEYLRANNVPEWADRCLTTIAGILSYTSRLCYPNLKIELYLYQQIPTGHGVLINGKTLYRGRCEWIHSLDGTSELRVGSRPYIRYSIDDQDGRDEVVTFMSWVNWVKLNSVKIEQSEMQEVITVQKKKSRRAQQWVERA